MRFRRFGALGRPRDPDFDHRALAAARQLLAERGFEDTTVQAIAERSGVHASALCLRWPSRIELIEEAVFPGDFALRIHVSGDLAKDLQAFVTAYVGIFAAPAMCAAMPGLLALQHAGRAGDPRRYLRVSTRPLLREILQVAPAGSVDPNIDPGDPWVA